MRFRLSVFRSGKHIYGQIIDDKKGQTIVGLGDLGNLGDISKLSKTEKARKVGQILAEKAKEKKVSEVVFDRGTFRYHGRVRALAEGAREGGLKF